jgi:hypothetical protein
MADIGHGAPGGPLNWLAGKAIGVILSGFAIGLITWGATQAIILDHSRRIVELETDKRRASAADVTNAERLARIEANLQFIVEEVRRQQAARR